MVTALYDSKALRARPFGVLSTVVRMPIRSVSVLFSGGVQRNIQEPRAQRGNGPTGDLNRVDPGS